MAPLLPWICTFCRVYLVAVALVGRNMITLARSLPVSAQRGKCMLSHENLEFVTGWGCGKGWGLRTPESSCTYKILKLWYIFLLLFCNPSAFGKVFLNRLLCLSCAPENCKRTFRPPMGRTVLMESVVVAARINKAPMQRCISGDERGNL